MAIEKEQDMYKAVCDYCEETLLIREEFTLMPDEISLKEEIDQHCWITYENGLMCEECRYKK